MAPKDDKRREWHTVSIDSVRAAIGTAVLAVVGVIGYFAYQSLEAHQIVGRATEVVEQADSLHDQVRSDERLAAFSEQFDLAKTSLQQAKGSLAEQDYETAFTSGSRARRLLQGIDDAMNNRDSEGQAQFVAVQGSVEYRRGTGGAWLSAHNRKLLHAGDYVKTSAQSSAEILFFDGTLFTINPNSVILVKRRSLGGVTSSKETIALEYGGVNLNTTQTASTVSTPESEANVDTESVARVAYDQQSKTTQFAAYEGGLEVAANGKTQRVDAMQQVTQGDTIGTPTALLQAPTQVAPVANFEATLESGQLDLTWRPVPAATSYAVQVSRNRLFVGNIIDDDDRTKPSAKLGLRGEGHFLWRVAAIDRNGEQGPWSAPRKFRVYSSAGGKKDETDVPSGP